MGNHRIREISSLTEKSFHTYLRIFISSLEEYMVDDDKDLKVSPIDPRIKTEIQNLVELIEDVQSHPELSNLPGMSGVIRSIVMLPPVIHPKIQNQANDCVKRIVEKSQYTENENKGWMGELNNYLKDRPEFIDIQPPPHQTDDGK